MAFLDNSGDIILDAVLTETGRQRMAQGNFRISKFALGDDEIDYSLYNKNHVSGSPFYDLEILQTPIFEAQTDLGINYGLTTADNKSLLYLPVLLQNTKTPVPNIAVPSVKNPDMIYIADTTTATTINLLKTSQLGNTRYFMVSGQTTGPAIVLETGIDSPDIAGDTTNKRTYLESNNLIDNFFIIEYDNRVFNSVLGSKRGGRFSNQQNGPGPVSLSYTLERSPTISTFTQLKNRSAARVAAIPDEVVYKSTNSPADTEVSPIRGPRGSVVVFNMDLRPDLTPTYQKLGSRDVDEFNTATLYDRVDTSVRVTGATTGVQQTVNFRVIKYKSG